MLTRYTTESGSYYEPLLHMRRSSTEFFPLYDAIGTARMLVDDSATITDTYHLDAWGSQLASTGSTVNPYRYGGAWGYITDPSGMLQLGARFYWPEIGRFVQQDPLGDGMNWYAYAYGNPLVWIDPYGMWSVGGEAYAGIGGGLTIGWDPCTGLFIKAKAGVGIGWGLSLDTGEVSPGRGADIMGHGSAYGLFGNAQAQALVAGWAANANIGNAYDAAGNWHPVGPKVQPPGFLPTWNWPPTKPKKVGWSVSAGAEGALF